MLSLLSKQYLDRFIRFCKVDSHFTIQRRMGQPRHRNKGAQPVPKAVYANMTGIVINATAYSVMIQL